jgi:alkaline phosphatase D
MVISGDVHMSFCMDLSRDPRNSAVYDGETGEGALGVEFIPTSISRGNFDEAGIAEPIANIAADLSGGINPHHQFTNFIDHGYGIVKITPDTLTAQIWYCDKLQITDDQTLGVEMLMLDGENRWHRPGQNPSSIQDLSETDPMTIFPNPANETLHVRFRETTNKNFQLNIFDTKGRNVLSANSSARKQLELSVSELNPGAYVLTATSDENLFKKSFVISR